MIDLEEPRMNNSRSTYPSRHSITVQPIHQLIRTSPGKSGRLKQPVWNGPVQRDSDLSTIVRKKGQKANGYLFKASKDLDSLLPHRRKKKLNHLNSWVKSAHVDEPFWIVESWMHFCCNIKVFRQIGRQIWLIDVINGDDDDRKKVGEPRIFNGIMIRV